MGPPTTCYRVWCEPLSRWPRTLPDPGVAPAGLVRGCSGGTEVPDGLEVVTAVRLEGHERRRVLDAGERGDLPGHHVHKVVVVADAHDGDQVGHAPGNGEDFGDPLGA